MAIERVFLDWRRPALAQVAEYLAGRFGSAEEIGLADVVVAVPGGRVGRRLMEILVDLAERRKSVLLPPRIVTAGQLPELLYHARLPFASSIVQHLTWFEAIRRCDAQQCREILPAVPDDGDLPARLALGDMLGRLHRELAADGLDFSSVCDCGESLPGFDEQRRWRALAAVQREYLHLLDSLNLWDLQTARLYAIRNTECRLDGRIVLVGTVDLNQSQRLMLDQVADRVTALVFAPETWADKFDAHGCLRPGAWAELPLPLDAEQIEVVDSPADQASAVVRAIARYEGRYSAEDIVVGVPDDRLVPFVRQHLQQCEIHAQYGGGQPLSRSGPYRLLAATAEYLASPTFSRFAALLRHPTLHTWLTGQGVQADYLTAIDEYYSEHLPHHLPKDTGTMASHVLALLERTLAPLRGEPRPLDQWSEPILQMLLELLGSQTYDPDAEPDRTVLAACRTVRDVLQEHAAIPAAVMPKVEAADAIRLVLGGLERAAEPPLPDPRAIELLGWLELPLHDAPAMIVTGVNEGIVPSSLNADLFLPNQLRRALGIEDNDRRYARDAYALALLASSRENLTLIAGRRTAEGDPLTPSRLLFTCEGRELAQRVQRFFKETPAGEEGEVSLGLLEPGCETSRLPVPRPKPLDDPVTSMRVTEFRDYLACPYRYYLRHRLGLDRVSDDAEELDGGGFGTLAHAVLAALDGSAVAESTDAQAIAAFLHTKLDETSARLFPAPLPAVLVQIEQLRMRLTAFARWQAEWAGQGWRIEHVEIQAAEGKAAMIVDGKPMLLRGRIDRIDVHRTSGQRVVFDYKTSDRARKPEETHQHHDQWVDLQLPLYRHLLAGLGIEGPASLGYIVLPKDTTKVGHHLAAWTDADLAGADRAAEHVIQQVRQEVFWPPADPPPDFSEEFSAICQDGRFGALVADEEESA
jgi:ATP-dependent helicase/nuclease subunit B